MRTRLLMSTRRSPDRGADLCRAIDRSRAVQIVEAGRSPFRLTRRSINPARTDYTAGSARSANSSVRTVLYEAPCHADEAVKGCSQLKSWAMRIARRAA